MLLTSTNWQYLENRLGLVEYVAHVAGILRLDNETVHVAMAYLDRIRQHFQTQRRRLVAALACLVVAAKFMETSEDSLGYILTPSHSLVLAALNNPEGLSVRHLAAYELRVLDALSWKLTAATSLAFAYAYRAKGLFCATEAPSPQSQEHLWNLVKFFCNLATNHGLSCTFSVSIAAAAAVAAARTSIGIPSWPEELERRFRYSKADIIDCENDILLKYRTEYPEHSSVVHADTTTADSASSVYTDTVSDKNETNFGALAAPNSCAETHDKTAGPQALQSVTPKTVCEGDATGGLASPKIGCRVETPLTVKRLARSISPPPTKTGVHSGGTAQRSKRPRLLSFPSSPA